VVFASTGGAIYGEVEPPTSEAAAAQPESPYGAAKLAAEEYVRMHARLYGLPHVVVRYANVYGPRQDPHGEAGVVAIFGGRALRDEPVTIYGDGTQTRDYVFVSDVVSATIAAGELTPAAGTVPMYNVGTGVETTVLELWEVIRAAAGSSTTASHADARAGELKRSALDASLAQAALGIPHWTPLDEGIAQTVDWMRSSG
jgi:UDP-glucose 4-epimerase